jgi:hypothetical protein
MRIDNDDVGPGLEERVARLESILRFQYPELFSPDPAEEREAQKYSLRVIDGGAGTAVPRCEACSRRLLPDGACPLCWP